MLGLWSWRVCWLMRRKENVEREVEMIDVEA